MCVDGNEAFGDHVRALLALQEPVRGLLPYLKVPGVGLYSTIEFKSSRCFFDTYCDAVLFHLAHLGAMISALETDGSLSMGGLEDGTEWLGREISKRDYFPTFVGDITSYSHKLLILKCEMNIYSNFFSTWRLTSARISFFTTNGRDALENKLLSQNSYKKHKAGACLEHEE